MDTPMRPPRVRTGTRSQEPDDAALRAAARAALRAKTRRATFEPRRTERRPSKHAFGSSLPPATIDRRRSPVPERRHSYVDYLRNGTPEKPRPSPVVYENEEEVREPLYLGCRVDVFDRKGRPRRLDCGVLKFLGPTAFSSGRQVWCGIELDLPYGTHDGEVEGRRYFGPVNQRCGLLVTAELCKRVPGQPSATKAAYDSSTDSVRTRSPVPIVAAPAPVVVAPPPPPPSKPLPSACRSDPALSALFADESLARYFKMLSVGVPRTAVAQKMKDDNVASDKCAVMAGQVNTPARPLSITKATPPSQKARTAPPPRSGFRRLHWNALDPQSAERSLYATDHLASPFDKSSRDFARLKSAFGERAPIVQSRRSVVATTTAVVEKKPQKATTLDARRAMNVGIMLGKLVGSGEGRFASARSCCEALMGGGLSVDQLELIIAIAPTDAEREKLVFRPSGIYEGSTQAEAALAELGTIPLCRQRADALLLLETALPRLAVVLVDAALRCKACRAVRSSSSLARFLATLLGAANATRLSEASGIELGSLLALARTRADGEERHRRTLLDFVVDVLSRRGERRTALCFAGPFARGDVLVAARSRRRRRLEASKKVTLSDDGDESESGASSSSSEDDEDDGGLASPSQKRRHRRQRRDLTRAARWLPACFAEDPACAETVVSRRVVHGGLKQCAHRGEPNELAAVVSTLRRRVAAARAVARADRASQFEGEREAAVKAISAARAAEKRRLDEDRDRAAKAAAAARRALDAAGMKERAAMAREDGLASKVRTSLKQARAEKAALVALGVLCAAARDADAYCERMRTKSPPPKETPQDWAAKRKAQVERARKIRADRLDFAPVEQPKEVKRPKTKKHGSWRPPQRIASAVLSSREGTAPFGVLRAAQQWASHTLQDRNRRAPVTRPSTNGASCYAPPSEDPRLMEPSDPRNPFFGLVERVLALASAAVAFPRALGYLDALAKTKPEPPPVERQLFTKKPPSMDGARAGLLAALTSKPVLKKKTVDQGPLPHHLTPSRRRQAGERLDAELDALEGALAAAEAAIACARAHGDALRVHVGCAPHEDAAEALEVVGQLSRLVDASLARAPLELETSDEEDAPRLRIGAVVSTKWGPAVVEARRPAADPAQPRRVVCRTFWRARVICEKADILRAPCPVSSPFGPVDLLDRVVKRADGALLCQVRLPGARGAVLLPPCSVVYVPPVATRVWRRRRPAASPRSGPVTPSGRSTPRCRSTPVASPRSGSRSGPGTPLSFVASESDDDSSAASDSSDLSDIGALGSFLEI